MGSTNILPAVKHNPLYLLLCIANIGSSQIKFSDFCFIADQLILLLHSLAAIFSKLKTTSDVNELEFFTLSKYKADHSSGDHKY